MPNTPAFWNFKTGFILASTSPQRRALLEKVRLFPDEIISPDVDETALKNELPLLYVKRIATLKAKAVAKLKPNTTILAADTIIAAGRRIITKAKTAEKAKQNIELLSNRKHRVITAICIITPTGKTIVRTSTTFVTLKKLDPYEIQLLLQTNEWQNVAGYRIEGLLSGFVKQISGSYDNIVGLPTYDVLQVFKGILR